MALGLSGSIFAQVDRKNIIIVGGGLAGLTAAHELKKQGVSCNIEIYEGRDRLGGRTWTHYFNDDKTSFFEFGGTVIYQEHEAIINKAEELGIELIQKGFGSRKFLVTHNNAELPLDKLVPAFKNLKHYLQSLLERLDNGEIALINSLESLCRELDEFHFRLLNRYLVLRDEAELSELTVSDIASVLHSLDQGLQLLSAKLDSSIAREDIDAEEFTYVAKDGMSHFINTFEEALKPEVSINLSHKLMAVKKERDYILTFAHEGTQKIVHADYVIMTIPFTTLREVDLDQSVGLTSLLQDSINNMAYYQHAKVATQVTGEQNLFDQLLYYINLDSNTEGWSDRQALTLFVDERTQELNDHVIAEMGIRHVHVIAQQFPGKAIGPVISKRWSIDPFARGSYSLGDDSDGISSAESARYKGLKRFAEPVDGLIFAGEHTSFYYAANMEGAVRSGNIAASILKDILLTKQNNKKRSRDDVSSDHEGDDIHARKIIKVVRTKSL